MIALLAGGHGFEWKVQGFYILDFAVYVIALVVVLRKPISEFVALRRERLVKDIEESKALKAEKEALLAEYTRRLESLEAERQKVLADARAAGEAEAKRVLAEAELTVARIQRDAQARIEQETRKIEQELRLHAVQVASREAERLVVERISDNDRRKMFTDYVEHLESRGSLQ